MMIRSPKKMLATAAGITLLAVLTGCGTVEKDTGGSKSSSPDPTATTQETVKKGVLTVCTNPPYAPFEETDGTEVVGFDMDLTSEVAKDLKLEVAFVEVSFESIESGAALETGVCDVGASALTITDERKAKLDFSTPYYETTMGLLVKADSGITDLAGLKDKPVGVQQGTTGEDWAHEQPELTQIKQYENLGDQVTALKAGDVVGVFNDEPTLTPYVNEGFAVVSSFDTGEQFGFAVKQGNQTILDQINSTLERLNSDGTYEQLLSKWFEAEPK
jgi:polar amino acid transport system substrate-binding protein